MTTGPRIYNLFPLLIGSVDKWAEHLPRIAAMGFDWVFVNAFHLTGASRSLYSVADYYRLDPRFEDGSKTGPDAQVAQFVEAASKHGLKVMMDLVINHTAIDSPLIAEHPDWYARGADGRVISPSVNNPADSQRPFVWRDLAEIDYAPRPERKRLLAYWKGLIDHYMALGVGGFRCDAAYKVPTEVWTELIGAARRKRKGAFFLGEALGCWLEHVDGLRGAGFDCIYNSSRWWDFRGKWVLDQYERFRRVGPSVSFPESHDTDRLTAELQARGMTDVRTIADACRQRYLFAAAFSTGVLMPVGFEYGFSRRLNVKSTRPRDWEEPLFDISPFIAEVNAMKANQPVLNEEGPQYRLYGGAAESTVLVRQAGKGGARVVTAINPCQDRESQFDLSAVPSISDSAADVREITPGASSQKTLPALGLEDLEPLSVRMFSVPAPRRRGRRPAVRKRIDRSDLSARPVIIQSIAPEVDGGRFPIKREVGDDLEVWAEIFTDGHVRIAAVLKLREAGTEEWRETPMQCDNAGLDRWVGRTRVMCNGRAAYTVEAWVDVFETWRDELVKKRDAGVDIAVELIEGRDLIAHAKDRASGIDAKHLERTLKDFDKAKKDEDRIWAVLDSDLRAVMRRCADRSRSVTYPPREVFVDRVQARFAAWYEMFHRSQGTIAGQSATFADCERRLPEIRDMGFDVIYFVPIHPIGKVHRKGPNNTLHAGPGDPGSPYAIGSDEGGHCDINPELGTLDDFRRFIRRCHDMGMEVALDFAIQCAPDHPWVKEHPEWFRFRPDGTIKYAENPPKKYEDIVNVNFDCADRDALWAALLDVVLFWAEQGVRIFRVDNPHTKPVEFWEWLIREVQERYPDTLFLAEAFTRPAPLKALAKAGFSQSYTYFTWRNTKRELTEYLNELVYSDACEYLRPNFFPNTPDILPPYLQKGGRPAFMVRFALASTLAGVYGIYNGFELCENRAIPGREEYLNSEKYEYKVWDWDRPGNIKDFISRINWIRRENPALHEFDNLRFYGASSNEVLFYGKMTPDRQNMIFVAVNLNPFDVREAGVEFPLHDMGLWDDASFEAEDLISGRKHFWKGAWQYVRLDPHVNPVEIFRVRRYEHVDFENPCL